MIFRFSRFWLVLLAPLSALLTFLSHKYPAVTERLFSRGLYRIVANGYGRIFGFLPFSIAQFLVFLLPVAIVSYLFYVIHRLIKNRMVRKRIVVRLFANISCALGIAWFLFAMLCGLNYAREDFASAIGLETRHSTAADLAALCEELALRLNEGSSYVTRDAQGLMVLSAGTVYALANQAREALDAAAADYQVLAGFCPLPKPVLYSRLMSRVNISGIYIPFTMEANVNVDICDYAIPSIMAHELAHFKGYMREDEANFIAYLACIASGSPDFIYSGEMLAFAHAANQLRTVSVPDYQRIMDGLADGVILDMRANSAYWKQFEGPVADFSRSVNDSYLKSNRQVDGVKSYGRMVDLLLADYHKRHDKNGK